MEEELVLLVDAHDNVIGEAPKLQAHRDGVLHRAISVFIFDRDGRILLQQRAAGKYHSAGLWSNASCTHPRPGEEAIDAARRRLQEEMGIDADLDFRFSFLYRAELDSGLTEHEVDHVFTGTTTEEPRPDPAEVGAWRWVEPDDLARELASSPDHFSAWFPLALSRLQVLQSEDRMRGTAEPDRSGGDG